MDSDTLKKLITKHKQLIPKYTEQKAYAVGNNPAIYLPRPKPSPDNRIAIPYIYSEVQFVKGYMFKAGNTKYSGDYYDSILKPIYDKNEEELINADEGEDWLIHGVVYELHWRENGFKYFWPIPPSQAIPIFDDKLKKNLIGFVYWRCIDDETEVATYYDATNREEWTSKKDNDDWEQTVKPTAHGYKQVPINMQYLNRDGRNFFDHVRGIIDFIDSFFSKDIANEAERFAGAYLLMRNRISMVADEFGLNDADKINLTKIFDRLDHDTPVQDQVAFLVRNIPTEFLTFAFTKAQELLAQNLTGLDPNNDKQTDASSGFALLLKLFRFELQCASYESRWIRFLQNRIRLIAGITESTSVKAPKGAEAVTITMSRNLPVNMQMLADVASKLVGILPEESVLGLFPTDVLGMSKEDALKSLEKSDLMNNPPVPPPIPVPGAE